MCCYARRAVLIVPLIALLSSYSAFGADLLRYTIRFDPFEIELTLPSGASQKKSLPRQPLYFYHRANVRWPIPEGPADKPVRCEIGKLCAGGRARNVPRMEPSPAELSGRRNPLLVHRGIYGVLRRDYALALGHLKSRPSSGTLQPNDSLLLWIARAEPRFQPHG